MKREYAETLFKAKRIPYDDSLIESDWVFFPFMVMDVAYQIYAKDVRDIPMIHMGNHWKKEIGRHYKRFNDRFFEPFSQEQTCDIVDYMANFEEYTNNVMMTLRVAVSNCVSYIPFEEQMRFCSMQLIVLLVRAANKYMYALYGGEDIDVTEMADAAVRLSKIYYTDILHRTEPRHISDDPVVADALESVLVKMQKWIHEDKSSLLS